MSAKHGEIVRWNAANGVVEGTILDYLGNNEWLVRLGSGKCVIVNQKSFLNG